LVTEGVTTSPNKRRQNGFSMLLNIPNALLSRYSLDV